MFVSTDTRYSSISSDNKYLIISSQYSSHGTQIYSNPLSNSSTLQQNLSRSLYHKLSKDGKYLITGYKNTQIYINCNWNTTGGYFLNTEGKC